MACTLHRPSYQVSWEAIFRLYGTVTMVGYWKIKHPTCWYTQAITVAGHMHHLCTYINQTNAGPLATDATGVLVLDTWKPCPVRRAHKGHLLFATCDIQLGSLASNHKGQCTMAWHGMTEWLLTWTLSQPPPKMVMGYCNVLTTCTKAFHYKIRIYPGCCTSLLCVPN